MPPLQANRPWTPSNSDSGTEGAGIAPVCLYTDLSSDDPMAFSWTSPSNPAIYSTGRGTTHQTQQQPQGDAIAAASLLALLVIGLVALLIATRR